jgi:hypothetical protein
MGALTGRLAVNLKNGESSQADTVKKTPKISSQEHQKSLPKNLLSRNI